MFGEAMLVKFLENKDYNEITFLKNEVYDFGNDLDFINRWIKRGCLIVDKADKVNPDPRFPLDVRLETPTEVEAVVDLPEVKEVEEVIEETLDEVESTEETIEVKSKSKKRGK